MINGFKNFIMRGNVVDLAIAVVIGTAFTKVVDAFVSGIVKPILNALPGASVNGWGFHLRGGELTQATTIDFSGIINAGIVFLLTAGVVYLVFVVPMQKVQNLRARGLGVEPTPVSEDTQLLREIRDALGARPVGGTAGLTPQHPNR